MANEKKIAKKWVKKEWNGVDKGMQLISVARTKQKKKKTKNNVI